MSDTPILDRVAGPADLKQLSDAELATLAGEVQFRPVWGAVKGFAAGLAASGCGRFVPSIRLSFSVAISAKQTAKACAGVQVRW